MEFNISYGSNLKKNNIYINMLCLNCKFIGIDWYWMFDFYFFILFKVLGYFVLLK